MATGRIHRASLGPVAAATGVGRIHRASVAAAVPAAVPGRGRIHRASVGALALVDVEAAYGRVHRASMVTYAQNRAPVVSIDKTTLTVDSGEDFRLTGYDADLDGTIVSRVWRIGAVQVGADAILNTRAVPVVQDTTVTYTYTATDNLGASTSVSAVVTVLRAYWSTTDGNGDRHGLVARTYTTNDLAAFNQPTP